MTVKSPHRRPIFWLVLLALVMFVFCYLMVPVYKKACEIGWQDSKREEAYAAKNTQVDETRWVTVEFVANVNEGLQWKFDPLQTSVRVHPGALTHVAYRATNLSGRRIVGQAVASYGPAQAGRYFRKFECFCFTKQPLNAGESKEMPVVFMVQRDMPQEIGTMTLSYTFFELKDSSGAEGKQK